MTIEPRHISDIFPGLYDPAGCCYVSPRHYIADDGKEYADSLDSIQCERTPAWELNSKLKRALSCDKHKDELLRHHKQFDVDATATKINPPE